MDHYFWYDEEFEFETSETFAYYLAEQQDPVNWAYQENRPSNFNTDWQEDSLWVNPMPPTKSVRADKMDLRVSPLELGYDGVGDIYLNVKNDLDGKRGTTMMANGRVTVTIRDSLEINFH